QPAGHAQVPRGIAADRRVQHILVGEERRHALVELAVRVRFVEAEVLAGELGSVTEPVPDLALDVFLAAEKDGARVAAAHRHHEDGLGLAESGEVIEAAVPPVLVVGVGVAGSLGRGAQHHDAVAQFLGEARAAFPEMLNLQGVFELHAVILPFAAGACCRMSEASSASPEASRRSITRGISTGRFCDSLNLPSTRATSISNPTIIPSIEET